MGQRGAQEGSYRIGGTLRLERSARDGATGKLAGFPQLYLAIMHVADTSQQVMLRRVPTSSRYAGPSSVLNGILATPRGSPNFSNNS